MRAKSRFSKPSVYPPEHVAITLQIHAVAADNHALSAQTQTLLEPRFTGEANQALRTEHAMPRHALARTQSPDYLPCRAGIPARRRDIAVGGHFAFRDTPHSLKYLVKHIYNCGMPDWLTALAIVAIPTSVALYLALSARSGRVWELSQEPKLRIPLSVFCACFWLLAGVFDLFGPRTPWHVRFWGIMSLMLSFRTLRSLWDFYRQMHPRQ